MKLKIVFRILSIFILLASCAIQGKKPWDPFKAIGKAFTHDYKEASKALTKTGKDIATGKTFKDIGKGFQDIGKGFTKAFQQDLSYFKTLKITNNLNSEIQVLIRWEGNWTGKTGLLGPLTAAEPPYYCNGDVYGIDFLCDSGSIKVGKTESFHFPYKKFESLNPKGNVELLVYKVSGSGPSKLFDILGYDIDVNSDISLGGDTSFYPVTVANCGGENLGSYTIDLRIATLKDFGKKVWDTIKGMFGFNPPFSPECQGDYCYASLSVPFGQSRTLGLPAGMSLGVTGKPEWRVTGAYLPPVVGFEQPNVAGPDPYVCSSGQKGCTTMGSNWHPYEKHKIYQVVANKSGVTCECPGHWRAPCSAVVGQKPCCLSKQEADDMKKRGKPCPKDDPFCCNKRSNDHHVTCCCSDESYENLEKAKEGDLSALPTCLCKTGESKEWCCSSAVSGLSCVNDNAVQSPAFEILTKQINALYQANC